MRHCTKSHSDLVKRCCAELWRFNVFFQMAAVRYLVFLRSQFLNCGYDSEINRCAKLCIGQTVAEIWRFCQNGGHPPRWILEIRNFIARKVKTVAMRYDTKFHGDRSNPC